LVLSMSILQHASVAQSVEYDHGKVGVTGSNPVGGFILYLRYFADRFGFKVGDNNYG
jgi:hypothetical protein